MLGLPLGTHLAPLAGVGLRALPRGGGLSADSSYNRWLLGVVATTEVPMCLGVDDCGVMRRLPLAAHKRSSWHSLSGPCILIFKACLLMLCAKRTNMIVRFLGLVVVVGGGGVGRRVCCFVLLFSLLNAYISFAILRADGWVSWCM